MAGDAIFAVLCGYGHNIRKILSLSFAYHHSGRPTRRHPARDEDTNWQPRRPPELFSLNYERPPLAPYFTADTHFGDDYIRRFFSRAFVSTQYMDAALVAGTLTIEATDDFWIIGDFACCDTETDREHAVAMFDLLPGQKHLVCGNHDDEWTKRELPWASVHNLVEIEANDRRFVLCHYPLITRNGARDGVIHLFGHVHTNRRGARGQLNVGVDLWDFRPVTAAEAELYALMLRPSKPRARAEGL